MIPRWVVPLILFILVTGPASAVTVTAEGVSSYSMVADSGMYIYQVTVDALPIGSSQIHTLNSKGNVYLITIDTYDDWGWKNADVSLTYPNGTTATVHTAAPSILGTYRTTIQPVFQQNYNSVYAFDIYLDVGISTAKAEFEATPVSMLQSQSSSIPFTSAQGSFDQSTTVWVEEIAIEDFTNKITNYDPNYNLLNLANQVFQWTWNGVIGFVNMVPVIGPITVDFLEIIGIVLTEAWFWLSFVVENFAAVAFGVEIMILMMAVINAGNGKRSFSRLMTNVKNYNLSFIRGCIFLVETVKGWTLPVIETISHIVQGLKPL
jgi:hypothetical protein